MRHGFEWRGFMLDASRHFWNKKEVKHVLDLMSLYKLNKFHWHLSDDRGLAYRDREIPVAYRKGTGVNSIRRIVPVWHVRKKKIIPISSIPEDKIRIVEGDTLMEVITPHDDIKEIVAYATQRGIDVIPEIDMPDISRQLSVNIRNWCVTD